MHYIAVVLFCVLLTSPSLAEEEYIDAEYPLSSVRPFLEVNETGPNADKYLLNSGHIEDEHWEESKGKALEMQGPNITNQLVLQFNRSCQRHLDLAFNCGPVMRTYLWRLRSYTASHLDSRLKCTFCCSLLAVRQCFHLALHYAHCKDDAYQYLPDIFNSNSSSILGNLKQANLTCEDAPGCTSSVQLTLTIFYSIGLAISALILCFVIFFICAEFFC